MRIDLQGDSMLERLALAAGHVPVPIGHALGGVLLARAIMVATRLGVFEALGPGPLAAPQVAERCGGHSDPTAKLLDALVASGYLTRSDSKYRLTPMSRRWMLKESETSLYDALLYQHVECGWLRRHRGLRATVLDLAEAIEHAAPMLAREGMGDRVVHRVGDARTDDLGASRYDLVLIAQLVHHFDQVTGRSLVRRAARALRSGGVLVIVDAVGGPRSTTQAACLLDLYFAFTSRAGTWSLGELASWQREAGLTPRRPIRLRRLPPFAAQAAIKQAG
jgi:SAM-dependent methyltransferase